MKISYGGFRVYLGTLSPHDADAIKMGADDEEIALNVPYDMHYAESFIEFAAQKYAAKEEFHLGVYLTGGQLIGMCALGSVDKANRKAELGYWIARKYWGNGYGKEALKLMSSFGFGKLGLNRIYAKVLTDNERSTRLLGSVGFKKEGTLRQEILRMGRFLDCFMFSTLKSEYFNTDIDVVGYE
jgi:RimJ/RimL family protein N-acetyltransferase